jgi:hypothetical protein
MIRHRRPRALLAALALTLAVAGACEDPFKLEARFATQNMVFSVWSLNSSPDEYPTVLDIAVSFVNGSSAQLERPDAGGGFDIAFDVGDDGRLRVIPVRLAVTPLSGTHAVNFIETDALLDQIASAPAGGWDADSTIVLDEGDVFLVRVFAPTCQLQLRQHLYVKFVVDSIILAERRAKLRGKLNPNCGFRSFLEGIPEF